MNKKVEAGPKHCFMCNGYRVVRYPGSWRDHWKNRIDKCPMCKRRTRGRIELSEAIRADEVRRHP